jgi:hypothetical protein
MNVKRLRWSAVLLALVLAMSWAGAAQAATSNTTPTTAPQETTPTTAPPTTAPPTTAPPTTAPPTTAPPTTAPPTTAPPTTAPPTTQPEPGGKLCSPEEGLESVSDISTDTASAHPSASVDFTVSRGCTVQLALVSFTGLLDEPGDLVDIAPPNEEDSFFTAGDHSLTVKLPDCSRFSVILFGLEPNESPVLLQSQARSLAAPSAPFSFSKPSAGRVSTLAATEEEGPVFVPLIETEGETTNCPTESSNPEVVPTTSGQGQLPFTGSNAMPIVIVGLVLVLGGAGALFASRMRNRQAS